VLFENRVLRGIFGLKRNEVTGVEWLGLLFVNVFPVLFP
jgi:hypothetical protein